MVLNFLTIAHNCSKMDGPIRISSPTEDIDAKLRVKLNSRDPVSFLLIPRGGNNKEQKIGVSKSCEDSCQKHYILPHFSLTFTLDIITIKHKTLHNYGIRSVFFKHTHKCINTLLFSLQLHTLLLLSYPTIFSPSLCLINGLWFESTFALSS